LSRPTWPGARGDGEKVARRPNGPLTSRPDGAQPASKIEITDSHLDESVIGHVVAYGEVAEHSWSGTGRDGRADGGRGPEFQQWRW
jgi:hypothetical protein